MARPESGADDAAVDSGWSSLPPAPSRPETPSLTQRLSSKRRTEGTLLGVAPPRSLTDDAAPSRRNPVVVHAGVAANASEADEVASVTARDALPTPVEPAAAEMLAVQQLPVPVAPAAVAPPLPQPTTTTRLVDESPEPVPVYVAALPFAHEPAAALKPPVAPTATMAPIEPETTGVFQGLAIRVRVLGVRAALWMIAVPALVASLTVCALFAFAAGSGRALRPPIVTEALPAPTASGAVLTPQPELDAAALMAKSPELRTAAEALALASMASEKRRVAAVQFDQELLQTPALIQKKAKLAEVRKLVADPLTAQQTLGTVARLPGPVGPDVLYELWSGAPSKTEATELARALLASQDVHSKVSDALAVALQMRVAESCSDLSLLLERARQVGDRRTLGPLTKWKRKRMCAAASQKDCCSTDQAKSIDSAIEAVKSRRAPLEGF